MASLYLSDSIEMIIKAPIMSLSGYVQHIGEVGYGLEMIFDISTAVNIQILIFSFMTPCSVIQGYRRSGGTCLCSKHSSNIILKLLVQKQFVKMRMYNAVE
jgi:hypothetical protein